MYSRILLTIALLFIPFSFTSASAVFPTESLWLSDMKPGVGEKIRIYAVVYNGGDTTLAGTITFFVDSKDNGRKDVSLDSGESIVVASPWTATEGEHRFSARFKGNNETADSQTSESVVATVVAPPSEIEKTVVQAKDISTQIASSSLPVVSAVANTVFETTEAIRTAGIGFFENKQSSATARGSQRATSSPVEGFAGPLASATQTASSEESGLLNNVAQTASAAALFTFKSMWLFYPILVLLLLLIFRWLYKWATGPRF